MQDIRLRVSELAQRAGLGGVPPGALAACVAVCVVVLAFALWHWWPSAGATPALKVETSNQRETPVSTLPSGGSARAAASSEATGVVFVHIVGAVTRPGLYRLPDGARVAEAVTAAGGLLGNAEERAVNLARPVRDGEQIVVPTQDEAARPAAGAASPSGTTPGAEGGAGAGPIDINSADAAALDSLPGIGPSTAAKIVADREANGPFSSPEDLGRVSGIGPKKLETLLGLIVVR